MSSNQKIIETAGVEPACESIIDACFYVCSLSIKSQCDTTDKKTLSYPDGWLVIRSLFKKHERTHAVRHTRSRSFVNRTRIIQVSRQK